MNVHCVRLKTIWSQRDVISSTKSTRDQSVEVHPTIWGLKTFNTSINEQGDGVENTLKKSGEFQNSEEWLICHGHMGESPVKGHKNY